MFKVEFETRTLVKIEKTCDISSKRFWVKKIKLRYKPNTVEEKQQNTGCKPKQAPAR